MLSGHGAGLSSMTGPSSMTTPAMTSYLDGSPLFEETLLVGAAADAEAAVLREPDRLLPAANVGRIMARALPNGCKVSKCARKLMQECISELICFVTSEVIERCQQRQQRIMTAADFISAARDLDLAEFVPSAEAMKPCISSRLDHGRSLEALAFPIPAQLPLLEQHLAHPIYGGLTRDATSMATPTSSLASSVSTASYTSGDGVDVRVEAAQGGWWSGHKRLRAEDDNINNIPLEELLCQDDFDDLCNALDDY